MQTCRACKGVSRISEQCQHQFPGCWESHASNWRVALQHTYVCYKAQSYDLIELLRKYVMQWCDLRTFICSSSWWRWSFVLCSVKAEKRHIHLPARSSDQQEFVVVLSVCFRYFLNYFILYQREAVLCDTLITVITLSSVMLLAS